MYYKQESNSAHVITELCHMRNTRHMGANPLDIVKLNIKY